MEKETEMTTGSGKDNNVVFVAGATGKVGSRVVRELVKSGFRVRAGVRAVARGQSLLEVCYSCLQCFVLNVVRPYCPGHSCC